MTVVSDPAVVLASVATTVARAWATIQYLRWFVPWARGYLVEPGDP